MYLLECHSPPNEILNQLAGDRGSGIQLTLKGFIPSFVLVRQTLCLFDYGPYLQLSLIR